MSWIILEIQQEALDPNVSVAGLLRKALVAATKLAVPAFADWLGKELNGYPDGNNLPAYRHARGGYMIQDPYRGNWIPIQFEDPRLVPLTSSQPILKSAAELESLLRAQSPGHALVIPVPVGLQAQLCEITGYQGQVAFFVDPSQLDRVLNGIRNAVLNWTLRLEQDGIVGEDLGFSTQEKTIAANSHYTVNNFYGDLTNTQVQQNSVDSRQEMTVSSPLSSEILSLVRELSAAKDSLGLETSAIAELRAEIATLAAQARSPKPKNSILLSSLESIRQILVAAAGGVGAHLLVQVGELITKLHGG